MRTVCVVVTARPSYSRIKTALVALKGRAEVKVIAAASAVVTRFGRIADQIKADGFDVTEVSSVVEEDSLANSALSTGVLLTQLSGIFAALKPDVVVTIADRHETLATAMAASYQHIPLCHVQGGEVTGSIDDKVRNAVTQLADIHCVATDLAAQRVSRMRPGAKVYVTGCPSIDLAAQYKPSGKRRWIIALQHPVTDEFNWTGEQMSRTIEAIGGRNDVKWFWPGEDAGAQAMTKSLRMWGLRPTRNLPPSKFLPLLANAACIVGNSSAGIREASYFGTPCVNIGHRQEGRERGWNVVDVGYDPLEIAEALEKQLKHGPYRPSRLYGDGSAGKRIAALLVAGVEERAA